MADVGRLDARLLIQLSLKRKYKQHMIDRGANLFDSLRPPGPDRWAHVVNSAHPLRAHAGFNAKVEVWRINADEHLRRRRQDTTNQLRTQPQQPWQMAYNLGIAADRQLAHMPPGVEAGGDHAVTADAGRL